MSKHEPVYAFRRKGLDDFCTCDKRRYDELAEKSDVFEVAIFYAAPLQRSEQDTALLRQALEALESCRPGDWSIGGVIQQGFDEKAVDAAETALRVALEGKT